MTAVTPVNRSKEVKPGYFIRSMGQSEFDPLFLKNAKKYYDDETQVFFYQTSLKEAEKKKIDRLKSRAGEFFELRLGVFFQNQFVGWSYSRQEPSDSLYMQNSGVVPEHRRKGLYSCLLKETLAVGLEMGFQCIWSLHRTTNNAIIIPKLQEGFIITGVEVSDTFGTRVRLAYYPNEIRRKMMDYRVGQIRPDAELKSRLGI